MIMQIIITGVKVYLIIMAIIACMAIGITIFQTIMNKQPDIFFTLNCSTMNNKSKYIGKDKVKVIKIAGISIYLIKRKGCAYWVIDNK